MFYVLYVQLLICFVCSTASTFTVLSFLLFVYYAFCMFYCWQVLHLYILLFVCSTFVCHILYMFCVLYVIRLCVLFFACSFRILCVFFFPDCPTCAQYQAMEMKMQEMFNLYQNLSQKVSATKAKGERKIFLVYIAMFLKMVQNSILTHVYHPPIHRPVSLTQHYHLHGANSSTIATFTTDICLQRPEGNVFYGLLKLPRTVILSVLKLHLLIGRFISGIFIDYYNYYTVLTWGSDSHIDDFFLFKIFYSCDL